MKKLVLCLFAITCATWSARAAIVCLAPTGTTTGTLTITAPITFTITTSGNNFAAGFDLSNWVTSDGSATNPFLMPNLAYSLNGAPGSLNSSFTDNSTVTSVNIGPNDGYTFSQSGYVAVKPNDTLTLLAGTYTIQTFAGFNPQCTQTFTGNVFAFNGSGARVSNIVTAPEPSTWALLGAGVAGLGVVTLRRRVRVG